MSQELRALSPRKAGELSISLSDSCPPLGTTFFNSVLAHTPHARSLSTHLLPNSSLAFGYIAADQVSAAFRIEVLSEVPGMSQRAVARLAKKLDEAAESNTPVEIGEEMRHLTLQVSVRWHLAHSRCIVEACCLVKVRQVKAAECGWFFLLVLCFACALCVGNGSTHTARAFSSTGSSRGCCSQLSEDRRHLYDRLMWWLHTQLPAGCDVVDYACTQGLPIGAYLRFAGCPGLPWCALPHCSLACYL